MRALNITLCTRYAILHEPLQISKIQSIQDAFNRISIMLANAILLEKTIEVRL
jgi:hypothetical protein